MKLGINIDHVATLRNARGGFYPDPLKAALVAEAAGADNITCHLREDRRHIKDTDVRNLRDHIGIPLNLEMAATQEMLDIAITLNPQAVTIVPEGRQELTTESGYRDFNTSLRETITTLGKHGIKVALFIDPTESAVHKAKDSGAEAVEFHTGEVCPQLETNADPQVVLSSLCTAANLTHSLGLDVHLGHGINYRVAHHMRLVPHAVEANIGHAIIAEAIFVGMNEAVQRMKGLLSQHK